MRRWKEKANAVHNRGQAEKTHGVAKSVLAANMAEYVATAVPQSRSWMSGLQERAMCG